MSESNYSSARQGANEDEATFAEEIELLKNLKALKDNGTFKSIVVLINSSNALEMDFLNPAICGEDYASMPPCGSAMWARPASTVWASCSPAL